jgi:integrase
VALSVKRIKKLSACPGRHSDGGNLFLEVRSKTSASWIFRWQKGKHKHSQGLGSLRTFDLHEARERARKLRQSLADGIDPRAAKAARGATYRECADEAFPSLSKNWRNPKHIAGWHNRSNSYILPIIGSLTVSDIDVAAVLRVLNQLLEGKTFWEARPETAQRSRADIERVLSWATVRGLRKGDNPARWNGFLETQLPSRGKKFAPVKHLAALPYADIPGFMARLRKHEGSGARALEFAVLCAVRSGAVIGATWLEVDFENRLWTIPPRPGAKTDVARRVPLSPTAIEILKSLPREEANNFIFIGALSGRGISNNTMAKVLKVMKVEATVHGFRSTFKDWAAECTDFQGHVSEAALWHTSSDEVERAYRRGDALAKRRALMNDWADYCTSGDNVVAMRAKVVS